MMPPTLRLLNKIERRELKRRLGKIADELAELDRWERAIRESRADLRAQQDALNAQVYRS